MAVIPVLSLIGGERDACALWRVVWPANALRAAGLPIYYAWRDEPGMEALADRARIICYPRQAWGATEELGAGEAARSVVEYAHANGRLVFGEYDDDIFMSRHEQKSHAELGKAHIPQATTAEACASLRQLDGVTVSSPRLQTVVETVAPGVPVRCVPNMLDLNYWRSAVPSRSAVRHPEARNVVTVGWFGGDRYDADIKPLADAWRIVAARTRAHFVVMGHQPAPLVEAVPRARLHQIAFMPLEREGDTPPYPVGVSQIDIACAVVAPTQFNAAKTPIKWIEATAGGAAVVGSSWLYGKAIKDGKTGLIADTAEELARAIIRLVERPHLRRQLRAAAWAEVQARHAIQSPAPYGARRWLAAWHGLAAEAAARIAASGAPFGHSG